MRITIIALGSQGDVQPYVALGKGLKAAGHDVNILSNENFETFVRSHELEFSAARGNIMEIVESEEMRKLLEKGNFLAINAHTAKAAQQAALHWAEDGLQACQNTELIVCGVGGLNLAVSLAEKLKLPMVQAYLFPFTPTAAFPGVLFPQSLQLGGAINQLSHIVLQQMIWQGSRAADTHARKQILKLNPAPFFGPYGSKILKQHPVLYGFSPSVIAKADDWHNTHVTGYWFLDAPTDWIPPTELTQFLEAGPPPVYIGFGSMSSRNPEATTTLIFEALAQTGQRAILLSGWNGLKANDVPDNVYMGKSVPHTWLFPRVSAVVHHGGAGTTAAGLRAGVPSIIIPFFGDQPFWGERVTALGVGPKAIPRKKLGAQQLAQAIRSAVSDQGMRQNAAALGKKIQTENGVASAVDIIEKVKV